MILRFDPFEQIEHTLAERRGQRQGMLALDAYRRGEVVYIHLDLPGVPREAVEITNERDTLTIRATRRYAEDDGDHILAQERAQGDFQRQIILSTALDVDRMTATLEDGVLTLQVPVTEASKPRHIAIDSEGRRQ
jgi:HSP20 family protein